jgi:hypothetical protein
MDDSEWEGRVVTIEPMRKLMHMDAKSLLTRVPTDLKEGRPTDLLPRIAQPFEDAWLKMIWSDKDRRRFNMQ